MPATACGPASCRRSAPRKVVERLMAPDMWSGWGIRTLSALQSGVQPLQLPDRLGLAARQRHHRARFQALRLRRRGGADRPRHQRRRQPFPAEPVAGALHRAAARRDHLPGAVSRRQRAAGLGRRARSSSCCRRCWASCRTRRTASSTSIRCCRAGCPTSRC